MAGCLGIGAFLITLLSNGPMKLPPKHKRPIDGVQLARVSVQDFGCVRGIDPEWAMALRDTQNQDTKTSSMEPRFAGYTSRRHECETRNSTTPNINQDEPRAQQHGILVSIHIPRKTISEGLLLLQLARN